jgi:hypothetical protein
MDNPHQTISNDIDNSHMTISKQQIKVSAVKLDPIFGPFCSKLAKIQPQNCPAAPLFIWPFLAYAAEQSDSWQQAATKIKGNRPLGSCRRTGINKGVK